MRFLYWHILTEDQLESMIEKENLEAYDMGRRILDDYIVRQEQLWRAKGVQEGAVAARKQAINELLSEFENVVKLCDVKNRTSAFQELKDKYA